MKITSRVRALRIPFQINLAPCVVLPREVYAFVAIGERTAVIDSGVAGSADSILAEAGQVPDMLTLTHAHPDHIGAARTIRERTKCTVAAHVNAVPWVENVDLQFKERPVPGFHTLVEGSVPVDRRLNDGDMVDLGGLTLHVIHTPGHSKDGISLWIEEEGVLITGDAVPLAGDLPIYDNPAALVASIRKLQRLKDVKWMLASWDKPRTGDEAPKIMDDCIAYVDKIGKVVASLADEPDPMSLCRKAVAELGLPVQAANPLVARTFQSHLRQMSGSAS